MVLGNYIMRAYSKNDRFDVVLPLPKVYKRKYINLIIHFQKIILKLQLHSPARKTDTCKF